MLFIIVSTLCFLAGIYIITWMHNQYQLDIVVEPLPPPQDAPLISVCVPARNEERNIRRCVEALLEQTYSNFEIIVLDDRSTDSTPEILQNLAEAADLRKIPLSVLSGSDLPQGWAGKPHALTQAAAVARGEWLCFVDADTFVSPDALAAVYAKALETQADLFTIMTRQIMLTFWERAVLPLVMLALSVGFSPRKVNDPRRKDAIANGQFIFIKRSVYEAVGGHAAIKGSIVEDKDMAVLVKGKGYRLVVADGRKVASTRMYTSLSEMWEGWTKNIYLGLRDDRGLLLLGVFGAFLAFTAALLLPLWVGGRSRFNGGRFRSGRKRGAHRSNIVVGLSDLLAGSGLARHGHPELVRTDDPPRGRCLRSHDAHVCLECIVGGGGHLEGKNVFVLKCDKSYNETGRILLN
jgi:chlorobactene glucosyltransferase